MKKTSKFMVARARRTMFGRAVCRLLGDQTGAVLMEYVVLGVLLVAAVVGAVVMFGEDIVGAFKVMGKAIFSPGQAQTEHTNQLNTNIPNRENAADAVNSALTDGAGGN